MRLKTLTASDGRRHMFFCHVEIPSHSLDEPVHVLGEQIDDDIDISSGTNDTVN